MSQTPPVINLSFSPESKDITRLWKLKQSKTHISESLSMHKYTSDFWNWIWKPQCREGRTHLYLVIWHSWSVVLGVVPCAGQLLQNHSILYEGNLRNSTRGWTALERKVPLYSYNCVFFEIVLLFAVRSNDCRPVPSKLWTPGTLGGMCLSISGPTCLHTRNK